MPAQTLCIPRSHPSQSSKVPHVAVGTDVVVALLMHHADVLHQGARLPERSNALGTDVVADLLVHRADDLKDVHRQVARSPERRVAVGTDVVAALSIPLILPLSSCTWQSHELDLTGPAFRDHTTFTACSTKNSALESIGSYEHVGVFRSSNLLRGELRGLRVSQSDRVSSR